MSPVFGVLRALFGSLTLLQTCPPIFCNFNRSDRNVLHTPLGVFFCLLLCDVANDLTLDFIQVLETDVRSDSAVGKAQLRAKRIKTFVVVSISSFFLSFLFPFFFFFFI